MKDKIIRDIDAIQGERWFPKESTMVDDMKDLWGNWGVNSEVKQLESVLMRKPGKEIENFDWQKARFKQEIDVELFRKQHEELVRIYESNNVKVYYIEEQRADRPNAVFCRDLVFMTPEGAIVTRPAMEVRRGEEKFAAKSLANIGVPIIRTICGDATFEGSMAMWVDKDTVILASGVRTNKSGYKMMESELIRLGVKEIIPMQIPYGHAHIDGLINFASEDIAMIYASQVPYDVCDALKRKGIKLLECPSQTEAKETFAINFVAIKPGLIIMPEGNHRSQELLEKNGIKVITLDFSEVMKGYGAIHCCTAFLKRK